MLKRLLSGRKETTTSPSAPAPAASTDRAGDRAGLAAMPPGALIACGGIDWNGESQLAFSREVLVTRGQAGRAVWTKSGGSSTESDLADADVLHAMVLHREPTRIMEVGCGSTTHVIRAALSAGNLPGELIAIDPEPRVDISEVVDAPMICPVQEIPRSDFEMLRAGEMLVLDLTHVIRPTGEVLYLYQHILPHLNPGVIVGIRGVALPYEYTAEERAAGWNEQALLQMLLTGNRKVRVVFAGGWVRANEPNEPGAASSWLWYEVVEAS